MSVLAPVRGRGPIAAANPVAKLGAAAVIALALIASIDWVSAAVALLLELGLFAAVGLPLRTVLLRTAPVWAAAPLAGLTILLYGRTSGTVYASWFVVVISDGSIALAIATVLRVLAIGLPAVVLFVTVDPTDLGDALAQVLRLPARFVLGALAGVRLVGLFADDWRSLELARRARGLGEDGRLRRLAGQSFALLVLALRRGGRLATAMEARGFGAPVQRTWARPSHLGRTDWVLLLAAAVIGATAVTVSVLTGAWNFIAGG